MPNSTTKTLRTPLALAEAGLISSAELEQIDAVTRRYAVALSPEVVNNIDASNPHDPIRLQYIPDARELHTKPGELSDPIGDHAHEPVPGIVHRHEDRVLLKLVHICPVYCRFCFRRTMLGPGNAEAPLSGQTLERALAYIQDHAEIWEVILTGGDPFILPTQTLREIVRRLERIKHVKVIRWHSRVPVADPVRVTEDFAKAIQGQRCQVFVVLHINHIKELTTNALAAIANLKMAHLPLLSQSVLLRRVNDSIEALAQLFRGLVEIGVKPYYLHQLDYAPGTDHFRVPIQEAQELVAGLRREISGLCQPTFVIDIPGGFGKIPAAKATVTQDGQSTTLTDLSGNRHLYPSEGQANHPVLERRDQPDNRHFSK